MAVVSTLRASPEAPDEEGAAKYADQEALMALQESLSQQQQEHERLIGTVAHLSNELEVNKEHVKVSVGSLCSGVRLVSFVGPLILVYLILYIHNVMCLSAVYVCICYSE